MSLIALEHRRTHTNEVESRFKADNVILNIKSQFESNSPLEELLFRICEQKLMKTAQEKQPLADLS